MSIVDREGLRLAAVLARQLANDVENLRLEADMLALRIEKLQRDAESAEEGADAKG